MRIIKLLGLGLLLLMANNADAQEVGEVMDSVKAGLKASSVKEAVHKVQDSFKAKKASADALIGTWQYMEPAVYATKGNLLMKLAGNATADKLEKLLQQYIDKRTVRRRTPRCRFIRTAPSSETLPTIRRRAYGW